MLILLVSELEVTAKALFNLKGENSTCLNDPCLAIFSVIKMLDV